MVYFFSQAFESKMSSGKIEHYSVVNCSVHVFTMCHTPKFILNTGSGQLSLNNQYLCLFNLENSLVSCQLFSNIVILVIIISLYV